MHGNPSQGGVELDFKSVRISASYYVYGKLTITVIVLCAFELFEKWGDKEEIVKEDGGRSVCDLLIDQIEFANVIMLNKIDLVSEEELNQVIAIVQRLNPCAVLATTHFANVPPEAVMNTGLFDFQKAKSHAGWLRVT